MILLRHFCIFKFFRLNESDLIAFAIIMLTVSMFVMKACHKDWILVVNYRRKI